MMGAHVEGTRHYKRSYLLKLLALQTEYQIQIVGFHFQNLIIQISQNCVIEEKNFPFYYTDVTTRLQKSWGGGGGRDGESCFQRPCLYNIILYLISDHYLFIGFIRMT